MLRVTAGSYPLTAVRRAAAVALIGSVVGVASAAAAIAEGPAPQVSSTAAPAPGTTAAVAPPPPAVGPPGFKAKSWVVADAQTGAVFAARDPHAHLPQASTLKVLTSETLLPRLNLRARYVGRPTDDAADGAEVGIVAGGQYTVRDLFHGLLLRSGNDAAMAIANAYGGPAKAIAAMNAEAARLHATDTVAMSPSGLDVPGQHSSAFDLATIMRAALQNPTFRALLAVKKAAFPVAGASEVIETLDPLAHENYPGLIGGKTGYTSNAGRTYVGAATQGNRTLIIAIMNYEASTKDAATTLMNWGFANATKLPPVAQLPLPDPIAAPVNAQPRQTGGIGSAGGAAGLSIAGHSRPAPNQRDDTAAVSASLLPESTIHRSQVIAIVLLLGVGVCLLGGATAALLRARRRT